MEKEENSSPMIEVASCDACAHHSAEGNGRYSCGCMKRLQHCHDLMYCQRRARYRQDATKCHGFNPAPPSEFESED